jgi:hypothetical protein
MSQADEEPVDLEACTAVLLSVPQQLAERIESFLTANGIRCRIRRNTEMTPERLAEGYLQQSSEASGVLDLPLLGPLLRGRLGENLKAEIEVVGSEIPPVWDVLVRPEDLPGSPDGSGETTPELNVPTPGRVSAMEATDAEPGPSEVAAAGGSPMILCELPWDQAWALTQRLNEAGIPAAVMAPEEPNRDRPMAARIVPVGVRREDLDRAQAFVT